MLNQNLDGVGGGGVGVGVGGGVDETLRQTQPKKFLNSIMGRCHIFLIL